MLTLIIINSLAVIFFRKPVNGILALVGVFFETAIIFITFGAEFLAILLITVYVGAIAILFLFVVMMLDIRLVNLHGTTYYSYPVGAFMGLCLIVVMASFLSEDIYYYLSMVETSGEGYLSYESNIKAIGQVLYNWYLDLVIIVSLILLIAMIGVIVITIDYDYTNRGEQIKRQNYEDHLKKRGKPPIQWTFKPWW